MDCCIQYINKSSTKIVYTFVYSSIFIYFKIESYLDNIVNYNEKFYA